MSSLTPKAVAKTARDALHAKLSAISVGYRPIVTRGAVYDFFLSRIALGIALGENKNLKGHSLQYHHAYTQTSLDSSIRRQTNASCSCNARRPTTARAAPSECENAEILAKTKQSTVRRQIPLVNAGYAVRIAIVSEAIERFIAVHAAKSSAGSFQGNDGTSPQRRKVNFIVLGGGMDAIGMWAIAVAEASGLEACLYEFDCKENCSVKKEALENSGLLTDTCCERCCKRSEKTCLVNQGYIDVSMDKTQTKNFRTPPAKDNDKEGSKSLHKCTCEKSNYSLVGVNLNDRESVLRAFSESTVEDDVPTFILCEMVLTYLGKGDVDILMTFVSDFFTHTEGCMTVVYELMGRTESPPPKGTQRVLNFSDDYNIRFRERLNRGNSSRMETEIQFPISPLGSDCASVERRLKKCGFICTTALPSGAAVLSCTSWSTLAPEPFDEHAALALHLRCYVVACGFSQSSDAALATKLCPLKKIRGTPTSATDGISIASIRKEDQESVRNIFLNTYSPLFGEYPAIRKMVKTALKNDLSGRPNKDAAGLSSETSSIGQRYEENWGGHFWTAAIVDERKAMMTKRRVVGCMGIRSCKSTEGEIRGSDAVTTFEIHRLAVDSDHRGMSIGKALLGKAEIFAKAIVQGDQLVRLVATTPSVLHAANGLYNSCGFDLREVKQMGTMEMKTYVKEC